MSVIVADIAALIDHAVLSPCATDEEIAQGCRIARKYNVAGIFVKPYAVRTAAELLRNSSVAVGVTVGFPHGSHTTAIKVAEARQAIADGADELDMVVNIGKVLSCDWAYVLNDIRVVVDVCHEADKIAKIIFENCYLGDEHKIRLCEICSLAGADFIKTSTGTAQGGATLEDVRLMRQHAPGAMKVKAAGGIRSLETLLAFRAAGADRIGTSSTETILEECAKQASKI